MKAALADYLQEMFAVKAVFVGTRRTDPHGQDLQFFQETDGDWPRFMRVHPVIDWHYREVWGVSVSYDLPWVVRNSKMLIWTVKTVHKGSRYPILFALRHGVYVVGQYG